MSLYNNIEGISVGFDVCPITGEEADYSFRTSGNYSGDGVSYRLPSLNPHTIIFMAKLTLNEESLALLVKHRELIKQQIINTQKPVFDIDGILAQELRRF